MFNKVKSHLSKMATPFLNDITSAVGGLTSGSAISGAEGKVAAQLLKKSPLEAKDSPMEALKRNPLDFSQVQYPLDLTNNEQGHYILFYTLMNRFGNAGQQLQFSADMGLGKVTSGGGMDFGGKKTIGDLRKKTGNVAAVKQDNSIYSEMPTHTSVTSAIALYMPPGVTVSYKNDYEVKETNFSGDIANMVGNVSSATSMADKLDAVTTGAVGGAAAFGKNVVGEALDAFGLGNATEVVSKALGVAVNPREEQFYTGPQFRSFSYTFDFWPRSQQELDAASNIISLFKYHSAPGMESKSAGRMFIVPSEFEIHYMYIDSADGEAKNNTYMNKIAKCVCTSVDVNYGPEGEFKAFSKTGAPIHYKLALGFTETEFITKNNIYNKGM